MHPLAMVSELDKLAFLLQIPIVAGTVNSGRDTLGAGLVINNWTGFCGMGTTTEMNSIDGVCKLSGKKAMEIEEMSKEALIDTLV